MTFLIIVAALLIAALLGWPVTALVLRLARSVDQAEAAHPKPGSGQVASARTSDAELAEVPVDTSTASPAQPEVQSRTEQLSRTELLSRTEQQPRAVLRGGMLIGILERLAVVLCLIFDQPTAIAFVIAVKGLGRYPELKETPAISERFIIGTLASMLWAVLVGIIARWLIGMLG